MISTHDRNVYRQSIHVAGYHQSLQYQSVMKPFKLPALFNWTHCCVKRVKGGVLNPREWSESREKNTQTSKDRLQSQLRNEAPTHFTLLCASALLCHLCCVRLTKNSFENRSLKLQTLPQNILGWNANCWLCFLDWNLPFKYFSTQI